MIINILSPKSGETVTTANDTLREFVANGGFREELHNSYDYMYPEIDATYNESSPKPVTFKWEVYDGAYKNTKDNKYYVKVLGTYIPIKFILMVSSDEDFENNIKFYSTESTSIDVYNFNIGEKYYCKVSAVGHDSIVAESEVVSFYTENLAPRFIYTPNCYNLRDLGGYVNSEGKRIKQGMIFRSGDPDRFYNDEDNEIISYNLGVKTHLCLRGDKLGEYHSSPFDTPDKKVDFYLLPMPAYSDIIDYPENVINAFKVLSNEENYPIFTNCLGGADRTGSLCMSILSVLKCDDKTIELDYEATNMAMYKARSVESDQIRGMKKALEKFDGDSYAEKFRNYLISIGITEERQEKIREFLLED